MLREHIENKIGSEILKASLRDWDDREDYQKKPGHHLKGMRLAFMGGDNKGTPGI